MSIGVDFTLRANSTAFTQGIARANNAVKDLRKELREAEVGRLGKPLKEALGVAGVIEGFKVAIETARELRKSLEEAGRPVSDNIASVARYGDALEEAWKGAKGLSVTMLSFFTKAGENWGTLIQKVRGYTDEQIKANEETGRAADLQEKQRDEAFKAAKEKSKTIDKEIKDQKEANETAGMSNEEKRNKLLEKRTKLLDEIDNMQEYDESGPQGETGKVFNVARKKKQLEADKLTGQIAELGKSLMSEADSKQKARDEKGRAEYEAARESDMKQQDAIREKFAPSVEQLANMSAGGFAAADDPRLIAKRILEKEKFAAEAGGRGDIKGAIKLGTEAQNLRASLEGVTGKGTALTAETAEQALKNALETTNKELVDVKSALAGLIKAQK